MTREQVSEQQQDQEHGPQSADDGFVGGVPAHLYNQVVALKPGDAQGLANLLSIFGSTYAPKILEIAASRLGNAVVQRAIQLRQGNARDEQLGLLATDEPVGTNQVAQQKYHSEGFREVRDIVESDGGPPVAAPTATPEAAPTTPQAATPEAKPPEAVATAATPEVHHLGGANHATPSEDAKQTAQHSMDADMDGATKYNDAHPALVAEFQELTNDLCCDWDSGSKGALDPTKVARWQVQHGLTGDGKIGPLTVAAARKAKRAPQVASIDPLDDGRVDV